jgi:predicted alpha/beta-hydrolase family hydrolase
LPRAAEILSVNTFDSKPVHIDVDVATRVSGLLTAPPSSKACFVVAHGAGAGMQHPFMVNLANDLGARGIATLRYQFPYMENLGKRPDPPARCHAAVRAAVATAHALLPALPLFAGGKSFGGRMTSQAQAIAPLAGVAGLAFLGFPLHPAAKPSDDRAKHLFDVHIPMLFVQGTRDNLAEIGLLTPLVARLGPSATPHAVEGADHSFHVLARSGRNDREVMRDILDTLAAWIGTIAR